MGHNTHSEILQQSKAIEAVFGNTTTTKMCSNAPCDGCLFGASKLVYFSLGVIAVCNAIFCLMISCVPETFAIKSQSCGNFDVFGSPNFLREGPPPKLLTEFYKSG